MLASIVIRTLNEARYLGELFEMIEAQKTPRFDVEVVVVDSGSTDETLEIAKRYRSRVVHITKKEFTFGRSLNWGCEAAQGDFLVFISGHCVPCDENWLHNLITPLIDTDVSYTYGKQVGGPTSKFSECQLFAKYFPDTDKVPQDGFFCNNANSALLKSAWKKFPFDEELTGLEDMELAKKIYQSGGKIGYVASAPVYHHHDETWSTVKRRYEREAIALQYIMPEVHLTLTDIIRYFSSAMLYDMSVALQEKKFWKSIKSILLFRFMQYWGSYRGNHEHRKLSQKQKEFYFYPKELNGGGKKSEPAKSGRLITNEGQ